MHGRETLGAFQFDQHHPLDQKIGAKPFIDDQVVEPDWDRLLPLNEKPVPGKALRKHRLVDRLQKTRTEPLMNFEPAIDGDGRDPLDIRIGPFASLREPIPASAPG